MAVERRRAKRAGAEPPSGGLPATSAPDHADTKPPGCHRLHCPKVHRSSAAQNKPPRRPPDFVSDPLVPPQKLPPQTGCARERRSSPWTGSAGFPNPPGNSRAFPGEASCANFFGRSPPEPSSPTLRADDPDYTPDATVHSAFFAPANYGPPAAVFPSKCSPKIWVVAEPRFVRR